LQCDRRHRGLMNDVVTQSEIIHYISRKSITYQVISTSLSIWHQARTGRHVPLVQLTHSDQTQIAKLSDSSRDSYRRSAAGKVIVINHVTSATPPGLADDKWSCDATSPDRLIGSYYYCDCHKRSAADITRNQTYRPAQLRTQTRTH